MGQADYIPLTWPLLCVKCLEADDICILYIRFITVFFHCFFLFQGPLSTECVRFPVSFWLEFFVPVEFRCLPLKVPETICCLTYMSLYRYIYHSIIFHFISVFFGCSFFQGQLSIETINMLPFFTLEYHR
jgi:hypothetical protein